MFGNSLTNRAFPPPSLRNFEKVLNYHASPTGQWFAARGLSFAERLSPDVLWDEALNPAEWKSRSLGFRCVGRAVKPPLRRGYPRGSEFGKKGSPESV